MVAMKQVKFHTVLYMWLPPAHIQHLTSKNSSQSGIKGCCQCSENPLLPFLQLLHPYEVFETTWSERIVQGRHQCCLLKVQQVSKRLSKTALPQLQFTDLSAAKNLSRLLFCSAVCSQVHLQPQPFRLGTCHLACATGTSQFSVTKSYSFCQILLCFSLFLSCFPSLFAYTVIQFYT